MSLNICQICQVLYPGQISLGNIRFSDPNSDGNLAINHWNVSGVAQPTTEYLLAQESVCEQPYAVSQLNNLIVPELQILLDTTAQARQYANAIYCMSFINSTNASWKADATAMLTWRDAVRTYYFEQYAIFSLPGATVPTVDEFMAGVPTITWPI